MKQRHFIIISIFIIMTAAWHVLLTMPTRQKHSELQSNLYDANMQIKDFRKIMMMAPEFYKNHEKIKLQKMQLSSQLYSKENLLSLFDELESRANKNNLDVIEFTPSVEELLLINRLMPDDNKPQTLNIAVTLNGRLKNIGTILKGVEAENFYQGVDFCRITNSIDGQINSDFIYGFKAVLGAIRKP